MYLQWQTEIVYSGSINTSDHSSIFHSYLGSEYRKALITDDGRYDRNGCQAFWIMIVILLMYRKTPWNNHASVITIILIYLRWQTEWFCSGSMDTHVDSSTKENVSNPAISRRHSCIEKPWNWKSLRTNLGSYAEGALQNRHSACLSRYIKFYGKII